MLFKDRKELADKYKIWVKQSIDNNHTMILDCAESLIAFLDLNGYLNDVVHGEWQVYYDEDSPQDGIWECSACGYIRFVDDITPMNYCPNCGAKMGGEK